MEAHVEKAQRERGWAEVWEEAHLENALRDAMKAQSWYLQAPKAVKQLSPALWADEAHMGLAIQRQVSGG